MLWKSIAALADRTVAMIEPASTACYVWKPDLDQLWSTAEAERDLPMSRRPGPKPTENWKLHVAGELHRIVVVERKQPPPASYFVQFCEDKSGYHPDIRAVQRLLRELLG